MCWWRNTINSLQRLLEGERVELIYKSCQIQLTPIENVIDIDTIAFLTLQLLYFLQGVVAIVSIVQFDNDGNAI